MYASARQSLWFDCCDCSGFASIPRSPKLFSCRCPVLQRKPEPCPHIHEGLDESIRERFVVVGAWRDPQPLHSARYGGIVDRLDVNAVLCEQQIARRLAPLRIPNKDRHDVGVARHDRKRGGVEYGFDARGSFLMSPAFPIRRLQVTDGGGGSRGGGRWQQRRGAAAKRS